MNDNDDILSAEFLLSPQETYEEYQAYCEEAARTHTLDPEALAQAAKELCQMLKRYSP
jgi:hypothetical protein